MLFMKKFAKCSAAMTISASGFAAAQRLAHGAERGMEGVAHAGLGEMGPAGDAGGMAAGAGEDQAHRTHTPATFSSVEVVIA